MPNFREYNQSQMSFLFLTPDKLLGETHPARIIDKIAETLDLQKNNRFLQKRREYPV